MNEYSAEELIYYHFMVCF